MPYSSSDSVSMLRKPHRWDISTGYGRLSTSGETKRIQRQVRLANSSANDGPRDQATLSGGCKIGVSSEFVKLGTDLLSTEANCRLGKSIRPGRQAHH